MADGKLFAADKIRGKRRAVKALVDWATAEPEKIDPSWSPWPIATPKRRRKRSPDPAGDGIGKASGPYQGGAVISSHCGPGTVGILFVAKED